MTLRSLCFVLEFSNHITAKLFVAYICEVWSESYWSRVLRNKKFATFLQYNLPSSWCNLSITVPVCLSLWNRSLHPGPHVIYCIYDTFSVLKFLPQRLVFSFGNRWKSGDAKLENKGDKEELSSCIQLQQPWQLGTSEQVHYPARAEWLKSTFFTSSLQSPDPTASVLLHNIYCLNCNHPQDNQPWLLPDYPER